MDTIAVKKALMMKWTAYAGQKNQDAREHQVTSIDRSTWKTLFSKFC
jgi:hypothetical protein